MNADLPGLDPVLAHAPHRIGRVTLAVRDLARMRDFYREVIGLEDLGRGGSPVGNPHPPHAEPAVQQPSRSTHGAASFDTPPPAAAQDERAGRFQNVSEDRAELGVDGRVLLVLRHRPGAKPWSPREAGLFHTAFLLPGRADLGAWLRHMAEAGHPITGASDHIVSEAVYLNDPEGNGIEVYADKPSRDWTWRDGSVAMSTERLDVPGVMAAARAPWAGAPAGTIVGHVHLQTGDLPRAAAFYADLLGFDITARYPGALFFGSGGYHHQLAGNIWNSRGAGHRPDGMAGLDEVELIVRDPAVLAATRARLARASIEAVDRETGLSVQDPWGTRLRLRPG